MSSERAAAQLLVEDESTRKVFDRIYRERSIRHSQLVDSTGEAEQAVEEAVRKLAKEHLIRFSGPTSLPSSFRSYVVTPEGLSTGRMLKRAKLFEGV